MAIGQVRMQWTVEENMDAIEWAIEAAHSRGARLCAFPELAVTGFHRRIVEWAKPEHIAPQVLRLQQICTRLRMAVTVGAPTFAGESRLNSQLMIDEGGNLQPPVPKNGLTPAEATFFTAGTTRPLALMHGLRTSAVICREVEDEQEVGRQLAPGSVDLVFWPGHMRPDPELPVQDPPTHVVRAQKMARSLGAYFVQANWPNALNRPEESAEAGHSAVISPAGELLFRLPKEAAGVGVFNLGDTSHEWVPQ
jgi:omega-amidase